MGCVFPEQIWPRAPPELPAQTQLIDQVYLDNGDDLSKYRWTLDGSWNHEIRSSWGTMQLK